MMQALIAGAVATVFAAAGYFAKMGVDAIRARRAKARQRTERLKQLRALLDESRDIFLNQNYKNRRLLAMLVTRVRADLAATAGRDGYDQVFYEQYEGMVPAESELQRLIRGTTVNSMHRVNGAMRQWIRDNHDIADSRASNGVRLAEQLKLLDQHLNDWFDKFDGLVAGDPKRSLVYLNDEKHHGRGFPREMEPAVADALLSLGENPQS